MTEAAREQFEGLGAEVPVSEDRSEDDEEVIEVMRENWDIVGIFLALETQWRVSITAGFDKPRIFWHGLDYTAADVVLRRSGHKKGRKALDRLAIMEDAALPVLNGAA